MERGPACVADYAWPNLWAPSLGGRFDTPSICFYASVVCFFVLGDCSCHYFSREEAGSRFRTWSSTRSCSSKSQNEVGAAFPVEYFVFRHCTVKEHTHMLVIIPVLNPLFDQPPTTPLDSCVLPVPRLFVWMRPTSVLAVTMEQHTYMIVTPCAWEYSIRFSISLDMHYSLASVLNPSSEEVYRRKSFSARFRTDFSPI